MYVKFSLATGGTLDIDTHVVGDSLRISP